MDTTTNDAARQMQPREFDELYRLEDTYWWFVGRRRLIRQLLETYAPTRDNRPGLRILDAGCGTGGTMKAVGELGEVHGCDAAWAALEYCRKRSFTNLACSRVEQLSYVDGSLDVVTSCDVLEHVADDGAALREIYRILRPGGIVVMTVPAHPYLWSEHDEALAHLRRYTRKEITGKLQEAGYRIEKFSSAVSFVFPVIFAFRMLQRLRTKQPEEPKTDLRILPALLNGALIGLLRIEMWLIRHFNLPIGTSFVVVGRKPE